MVLQACGIALALCKLFLRLQCLHISRAETVPPSETRQMQLIVAAALTRKTLEVQPDTACISLWTLELVTDQTAVC